ncbi:hypothetical protein DTO166G4_7094 [Paecilomyces variotii]|nr:hypothetical protein DTO166G4_7094 [Paecilomyces variotii]KAJ9238702.1 hypothetical protein DTO166G5_2823 [Paecilomyces variotii]
MSTNPSSIHDSIKKDPYPPNSSFLDRYDPDALSAARDGGLTHPTTSETDEELGYVNRDPERDFRGSRESKGGQYAQAEKEKEEWGDKRGE